MGYIKFLTKKTFNKKSKDLNLKVNKNMKELRDLSEPDGTFVLHVKGISKTLQLNNIDCEVLVKAESIILLQSKIDNFFSQTKWNNFNLELNLYPFNGKVIE